MNQIKRSIALLTLFLLCLGFSGCTEYRTMDTFAYLKELEQSELNLTREPKLLQKDGDFYALYRLKGTIPVLIVLQSDEGDNLRRVRFVFTKDSGISPADALLLCGKGLAVFGRLPEEECVAISQNFDQEAFFAFGQDTRQFSGFTLQKTATPLFAVIEISDQFNDT